MKKKNIFLDGPFLFSIQFSVLGFLYQNTITLLILILILMMDDASVNRLLESFTRIEVLVRLFFWFGIVALIMFGFNFVARRNPLSTPIILISDFNQFKRETAGLSRELDKTIRYAVPITVFSIGVFIFAINYLSGSGWTDAIFRATVAMIPFQLGFLMVYTILVSLEILLLLMRYLIHGW